MLEAHILGKFDPQRQFEQLIKSGVRPLIISYDMILTSSSSPIPHCFPPSTFTQHQTRVDGRALTGLRRLSVVRGILQKTTAGSALVKVGGTKVIAGVTLQVGRPGEETPGKGEIGAYVRAYVHASMTVVSQVIYVILMCSRRPPVPSSILSVASSGVEVQLPPLCHPKYTSLQTQHEEGRALETFVQSLVLKCGVVRREDLCITEGRHVWKLNVDVHCLSHEGSLPDACALAALAALSDVKLPGTVITKDDEALIVPGASSESAPIFSCLY